MSRLKLAAAVLGLGLLAAAPAAEAQWGPPGPGYGQAPVWVPPKVARKQAERRAKIISKYGIYPGYGYRAGPPYGNAYGYRRNRGYDYGYGPRRYRESYGYRRDYW